MLFSGIFQASITIKNIKQNALRDITYRPVNSLHITSVDYPTFRSVTHSQVPIHTPSWQTETSLVNNVCIINAWKWNKWEMNPRPLELNPEQHCLPWNVGRCSGDSCQHRGIHLVANDTNSAGPVIASNGGRLPFITAVLTCSLLIAVKTIHQTQHMQCQSM